MGCISTALTFVPWGKVFKAVKVGIEAVKIWRKLDRAYVAVKDAEEAAKVAKDAVEVERGIAKSAEAERAAAGTEGAGEEAAGCAAHSFLPGTAVRLANGSSRPISQLKIGDTVLATDPQTGVSAPEKVQNVIVTHTDKDFTTLTLDTAPTRGPPHTSVHASTRQTLTTTWHHPFWDTTHHHWTDAHRLRPGTKLRQPDDTTVTVTAVHNFHQHSTTYDLTISTLHTYYVLAGTVPVLVHNSGSCERVIGHNPDYQLLARESGGRYFEVPKGRYSWEVNQKFLDRGIRNGDTFRLATSLDDMRKGSVYEREVYYLLGNGYTFNSTEDALIPKAR